MATQLVRSRFAYRGGKRTAQRCWRGESRSSHQQVPLGWGGPKGSGAGWARRGRPGARGAWKMVFRVTQEECSLGLQVARRREAELRAEERCGGAVARCFCRAGGPVRDDAAVDVKVVGHHGKCDGHVEEQGREL